MTQQRRVWWGDYRTTEYASIAAETTIAVLPLAAIGVHTAAMLAVIALIASVVYEWLGLAFLRKGWINVDMLWVAALAMTGLVLVF